MAFLISDITVENFKGRVRLRWTLGCRYSLSVGEDYGPKGIEKAHVLVSFIYKDIVTGQFDTTLSRYKKKKYTKKAVDSKGYLALFNHWVTNVLAQDIDNNSNYYNCLPLLKNVSSLESVCANLQKINFADSYNRKLRVIKKFAGWLYEHHYCQANPLSDYTYKRVKKKAVSAANELREPFSEIEISQILSAFKNDTFSKGHYKHSHYYPFLYFMFRTGVRNQEAIGLQVKHIDTVRNYIKIEQAMARCNGKSYERRLKETKTGTVRLLPLTPDLMEVLQPVINNNKQNPHAHLFTTQNGNIIDDRNFQRRLLYPVLDKLQIRKRNLYAVRHSFGSRAIEQGMNILQVSELMGNSTRVLLNHYASIINKPKELPAMQL